MNDERYTINYSQRYGYIIEFSEPIVETLEKMCNTDIDKFESLTSDIRLCDKLSSTELNIYSDVIELGFIETIEPFEIRNGNITYPQEIIDLTDKVMEIIEIYCDPNSQYFSCPDCGQYIYEDICETDKFWKEDDNGVEHHLMMYKCSECGKWIDQDQIGKE